MREKFPQLVFHTPKRRNKSEIVYAASIGQGDVAEHYLSNEDSQTSQSDIETEDEVWDEQPLKNYEHKAATLKEAYNVALTLRNILRSCTKPWYDTWPPLASDITKESVMKLVTQPETPQTCCKLRTLPACCKLSTSCSKSVDFIKLQQVCENQPCCNLI